eukprot:2800704-Rhodomonas_salina.1
MQYHTAYSVQRTAYTLDPRPSTLGPRPSETLCLNIRKLHIRFLIKLPKRASLLFQIVHDAARGLERLMRRRRLYGVRESRSREQGKVFEGGREVGG